MDIIDFLRRDGKPVAASRGCAAGPNLADLRDRYLQAHDNGSLEPTPSRAYGTTSGTSREHSARISNSGP